MQQEKIFTFSDLRLAFYEAIYIANPTMMPPSKELEFKFERIAEQLEARRLALDANPDDHFFEFSDTATATEQTTHPSAV